MDALRPCRNNLVYFSPHEALTTLGGRDDLLAEVLGIYLSDVGDCLARLKEAAASGNCVAAWHMAHAIQGESLMIAADMAAKVSRDVELAARDGQIVRVEFMTPIVERVLKATFDEIRGYLGQPPADQATEAPLPLEEPPSLPSPLPSAGLSLRPRVRTANGESADCLSFM
jgi:HPt (histidine-containing phosphotransfer) domain-containing protein